MCRHTRRVQSDYSNSKQCKASQPNKKLQSFDDEAKTCLDICQLMKIVWNLLLMTTPLPLLLLWYQSGEREPVFMHLLQLFGRRIWNAQNETFRHIHSIYEQQRLLLASQNYSRFEFLAQLSLPEILVESRKPGCRWWKPNALDGSSEDRDYQVYK